MVSPFRTWSQHSTVHSAVLTESCLKGFPKSAGPNSREGVGSVEHFEVLCSYCFAHSEL